jgi:hypothetical protein
MATKVDGSRYPHRFNFVLLSTGCDIGLLAIRQAPDEITR